MNSLAVQKEAGELPTTSASLLYFMLVWWIGRRWNFVLPMKASHGLPQQLLPKWNYLLTRFAESLNCTWQQKARYILDAYLGFISVWTPGCDSLCCQGPGLNLWYALISLKLSGFWPVFFLPFVCFFCLLTILCFYHLCDRRANFNIHTLW